MVLYIVKKDGSLEKFQPEKVTKSCKKAGASDDLAEKVADEISTLAYMQMTTQEIREEVIDLLKRFDPKVARAYAEFKKKKD